MRIGLVGYSWATAAGAKAHARSTVDTVHTQKICVIFIASSGSRCWSESADVRHGTAFRGTHSSRSTRIGEKVRLRLFKGGDRYLSPRGREIVQKFFERVSALDVVNECLNGDACTDENRSASEDIRIRM